MKGVPHLQELYDAYGPSGLNFVAITDEAEETIRPFAEKRKITYPLGIGNTWQAYGIEALPTAVLIVDGKVQWIGDPADDSWQNGLEELLKKYGAKSAPTLTPGEAAERLAFAVTLDDKADPLSRWEAWHLRQSVADSGLYPADSPEQAKARDAADIARKHAAAAPAGEAVLKRMLEAIAIGEATATVLRQDGEMLAEEMAKATAALQSVLTEAPDSWHASRAKKLLDVLAGKGE